MLVRAKEACFTGGQRRRAGAEFEYEGETLPPHLVPVNEAPVVEAKVAQKPVALSEMAMSEAKPKSFIDSVTKNKTGPK
jgi:hypothetical protein